MVLLDCVIRMKCISEAPAERASWSIMNNSTVPEDESNLLNLYSSIISKPRLIENLNFPEV